MEQALEGLSQDAKGEESPADVDEAPVDDPVENEDNEGDEKPAAEAEETDEPDPDEEPKSEVPERTWKAIARREKEIRKQLEEIKAAKGRLAQVERDADHYKGLASEYDRRLQTNPLAELSRVGIDFETVAKQVLADGRPIAAKGKKEPAPNDEIGGLKAEIQAMKSERLINNFRNDVRKQATAEEFPVIAQIGENGIEAVLRKAQEFANSGETLPEIGEIMELVEHEAISELRQMHELISQPSVLKALGLQSAGALENSGQSPAPRSGKKTPKSLTNNSRGAVPAGSEKKPLYEMSDEEQIEMALRSMRN